MIFVIKDNYGYVFLKEDQENEELIEKFLKTMPDDFELVLTARNYALYGGVTLSYFEDVFPLSFFFIKEQRLYYDEIVMFPTEHFRNNIDLFLKMFDRYESNKYYDWVKQYLRDNNHV